MVARAASKILQHKMRKICSPSTILYDQLAINFCNRLLSGGSAISMRYWNTKLRATLLQRFPGALSAEEASLSDLRTLCDLSVFFDRLGQLNGLQFTEELKARFATNPSLLRESECALTNKDFIAILPTTKIIDAVPLDEHLKCEGRFADIEQIYKRELSIKETALGVNSLSVIPSCHNLAQLYEKHKDCSDLFF
jgi:hypothetical protein